MKLMSQETLQKRAEPERKARPVLSSKTSSEAQDGLVIYHVKSVLCLIAVLCTIVLGMVSFFLSLDVSKDGDKKCRVWSSMGFKAFKVFVLVVLVLTLT